MERNRLIRRRFKCFTCSFVVDQFAHFALHHSQCFPRRLLHQQPQLPQVGKCEQVVDSITLMRSSRENENDYTRGSWTVVQVERMRLAMSVCRTRKAALPELQRWITARTFFCRILRCCSEVDLQPPKSNQFMWRRHLLFQKFPQGVLEILRREGRRDFSGAEASKQTQYI